MSNNYQQIACISGIRDPEALHHYENCLKELGITYKQRFLYQTDILIVSTVFKEKYKVNHALIQIWRSFRKRIPCVRISWIEDSYREGKILPTKQYEISSVFGECQIGVCGFSEEDSLKIKAII